MGRIPDALAHFERALQADPDDVMSIDRVAWILATSTDDRLRNGARAETLAAHAVVLTHVSDVRSLDTLAAAQAEQGRFDDAIVSETRAIALAQAQGAPLEVLQSHVAAYRRGERVRE
jgi:cytochrome c-type biogenesis protein CcmH/NrfG